VFARVSGIAAVRATECRPYGFQLFGRSVNAPTGFVHIWEFTEMPLRVFHILPIHVNKAKISRLRSK